MTNVSLAKSGLVTSLCVLLALCSVYPAAALAGPNGSVGQSGTVLVVDGSGNADYHSIAAAARNASDGDTIHVRPGTYDGGITLDANVTLVAPDGVTIRPASDDPAAVGIRILNGSHTAPTITGVDVHGFEFGVDAWNTSGDWRLENATLQNQSYAAIRASHTTGAWHVRNATIEDVANIGVFTRRATGDWTVERTTIRNATTGVEAGRTSGDWRLSDVAIMNVQYGVKAVASSGNWTAYNLTVRSTAGPEADDDEVLFVGVVAGPSTGSWQVSESTISDAIVGVSAWHANGSFTVTESRFTNISESSRYRFYQPPYTEGVGVFATDASGGWTVRNNTMDNLDGPAVDATDASLTGRVENLDTTAVAGERCIGDTCTTDRTTTQPNTASSTTTQPDTTNTATPTATTTPPATTTTSSTNENSGTTSIPASTPRLGVSIGALAGLSLFIRSRS